MLYQLSHVRVAVGQDSKTCARPARCRSHLLLMWVTARAFDVIAAVNEGSAAGVGWAEVDAQDEHPVVDRGRGVADDGEVLEVLLRLL